MIKTTMQRRGKTLVPFSLEGVGDIKGFPENQLLSVSITGTRRPRSLEQNKWIHAVFRFVAMNTENTEWNTPDKVKRNVKLAIKFFKDDVAVIGNKVYFELRSFAFGKMNQVEADKVFDEAVKVCADFLGVDKEVLKAEARNETAT